MFFRVLLLTTLNKNEFEEILNDYSMYIPYYECTSRTKDNIHPDDFLNKELIIMGIGDGSFDIIDYTDNLISANLNGTPVGFTHGTPVPNPFIEEEDTEKIEKYNNFLKFFGIDDFLGRDYRFYTEVATKNDFLTHDISVGPIPLDFNGNIPILETHDLGIVLNEEYTILLDDPNQSESRDNFYLAVHDPKDFNEESTRGRIAYLNLGHNYYSGQQFFKPDSLEKNLTVNVCSWLLNLNPNPV